MGNEVSNLVPTNNSPIICFLLINKIVDLPHLIVQSALENSSLDIYIGYINEADLEDLPNSERIHFISLKVQAANLGVESGRYVGFNKNSFFILVQLKWVLFQQLMESNLAPFIIYSDLDVIWLRDPIKAINDGFRANELAQIFLQDFSSTPAEPSLCMGFFAFKNNKQVFQIIEEFRKIHHSMLKVNPQTGDDDVITKYYIDNGMPLDIQRLPQGTFPVGNMLNAYSKRSLFFGVPRIDPFIFHANFVVGNSRKVQLLLIMHKQILGRLPSGFLIKYIIARIKNLLRICKNQMLWRA